MWHWLRNEEQARLIFWLKLILCASCMHLVVLGYIFVAYQEYTVHRIALNVPSVQCNVPVVFMPLYKRTGQSLATAVAAPGACNVKQAVQSKKKSPQKKVTAPVATSIEKPKPTTRAEEKKQPKKKNGSEKNLQKKVPSVQEPNKKVAAKKLEITPDKKKVAPEKSKEPIKASDCAPKVEKKQQEPDTPRMSVSEHAVVHDAPVEPLYVGQEEWLALQLKEVIEKELEQHWKVPVGFAPDLVCEISVIVDKRGSIDRVKVAKGSGVLAYDISARTAAQCMKLPKIAWGKEFIIAFKQ